MVGSSASSIANGVGSVFCRLTVDDDDDAISENYNRIVLIIDLMIMYVN